MHIPQTIRIFVDEILVTDEAAEVLDAEGITAEQLAERFSSEQWDFYGPSPVEVQRSLQYRLPIECAFVMPYADEILVCRWLGGFLTVAVQDED